MAVPGVGVGGSHWHPAMSGKGRGVRHRFRAAGRQNVPLYQTQPAGES